jgi:hypothetical protein
LLKQNLRKKITEAFHFFSLKTPIIYSIFAILKPIKEKSQT